MTDDLNEIVASSRRIGIEIIELGANVKHHGRTDLIKSLKNYSDIDFLIHHYFPAPHDPFVCNIAHPATVERACEFIKKNIEMCGALGIPFYSLHAGYGINPAPKQLGKRQSSLKPIPYDQTVKLFIDTAMKLEKFALGYRVNLLWENNVVSSTNLFGTARTPYLFADIQFLRELENDEWWKNALILLDIGHLKVSANTLNYAVEEFIERIAERVVHVHLSDNDGLDDTNQPVSSDTLSMFEKLKACVNLKIAILEVYKIPLLQIREQINFIREHIVCQGM